MQLYGGSNHVPLHQVSGFYGKVGLLMWTTCVWFLVSAAVFEDERFTKTYLKAYILVPHNQEVNKGKVGPSCHQLRSFCALSYKAVCMLCIIVISVAFNRVLWVNKENVIELLEKL